MHATEEAIELIDGHETEIDGHEAEKTIDILQPVINRLKTTRNRHIDRANTDEKGHTTLDFPWAVAALESLIEKISSIDTLQYTVGVSYIDVIGEKRSKQMWSIEDTEIAGANECQFYVCAEGPVVYWLIDHSTGAARAAQLDLSLDSLKQLEKQDLHHLEKVSGYLIDAVT